MRLRRVSQALELAIVPGECHRLIFSLIGRTQHKTVLECGNAGHSELDQGSPRCHQHGLFGKVKHSTPLLPRQSEMFLAELCMG